MSALLEAYHESYQLAMNILFEAGVFKECDFHPGEFSEGPNEIEAAYRLANSKITSGKIKLAKGETRRDITDLIRDVYHDNFGGTAGCGYCAKNAAS